MGAREKKKAKQARAWAVRQYERHRRHNKVYAKPGKHEFIVILDGLKPSYNIGKIFRSGDGFGAREIHLIGIDYFETKAAKGSFKWVPARFHENFDECYQQLTAREYKLFVFKPGANLALHQVEFPVKSGFIFGHEEYGISFSPDRYPSVVSLSIPQVGQVGCLNVSVAASIVMYEYYRQHIEFAAE